MDDDPKHRDSATDGLTVAVVAAVVVFCAGTLLIAAGVIASAGVLFDNLLVIAVGAGVLGWAIARALRALRSRARSAERDRGGA